MKRKAIYKTPVTEILHFPAEDLLNPHTYNPDTGYGDDFGMNEGDPDDGSNDKGAKAYNSDLFEIDWDVDFWESNFKSLWD